MDEYNRLADFISSELDDLKSYIDDRINKAVEELKNEVGYDALGDELDDICSRIGDLDDKIEAVAGDVEVGNSAVNDCKDEILNAIDGLIFKIEYHYNDHDYRLSKLRQCLKE